ncbi:unnamed protein product [Calicophoron daubneyi]|uniref:EF-hand domain-containing protein n=1 Tax=Calicophoron daubneyi TaxID=300641 RepID=A0AAV2TK53_CALDB
MSKSACARDQCSNTLKYPMSTDLDLKHVLEESFDTIDLNHDGFLSQDEVSAALEKLGLNRSRAWAFIKKFDVDRDGKISKQEFVLASQYKLDQREVSCSCLRKMFQQIDKNRDGRLTKEELKAFIRTQCDFVFPSSVDAWIDEYDKSGDGKLNYEEFIDFVSDYL